MNLWTLGILYIVLNTVGTVQSMMSNQAAVNFGFTKMLEENKLLGCIGMVLIAEVSVLFWSPITLIRNIVALVKGSFK